MKKEFSNKWKSSKQPRKQRKYLANAPLKTRRNLLSCNLNKKLREKYKRRNFPLRKGDEVKILRGEFKKKTGKTSSVDLKRIRVSIEGINRTKKDGTKINVYFNPSNLQIQDLNIDDKKRIKSIEKEKKEKEFKKLPKQEESKDASKKK
ncbi:50S ribosomal protein L24 [Candidatus Pacearchaeota archaeon]|nr:50S ribosomal protein L24 [Candidatus Pacearchaeota archaeon]MBD3282930.1 50S ribosomal protein L24 [Candidatus Pacearchaeota archaeon]